jgi:hypothetical protein
MSSYSSMKSEAARGRLVDSARAGAFFAEERRLLAAGQPIQKNSRSKNLILCYVTDCCESADDCRRIPSSRKMSATRSSCLGLSRARRRRSTRPLLLESSKQAHRQHLHAGAEWLLRHLRSRYWIMAGRATVRAVISKCVECQVATKPLEQQKMAPLPKARLGESKPWVDVGVDFAGPFGVKPPESKKKKSGGAGGAGEKRAGAAEN